MAELHLIHGSDEALVGQAATELVRRLVGSADRSLMVADLTLDGAEVTVGHVVAEAQTPPFLTDTRVVVVRGAERLDADGVAALQVYLGAPLSTTDLVLIHAGKPTKKLLDAVKGAGGVVAAPDVGSNRRDRSSFVDEQVAASGLRLTTAATAALVDQLGEDVNRLAGILDTLVATFGTGGRLDVDDVAPYLGEGGGIPPWDLTDAIDRGDRPAALGALSRMVHAGGRHPLVVMAILHTHYGRLLRLDGSGRARRGERRRRPRAQGLRGPQGGRAGARHGTRRDPQRHPADGAGRHGPAGAAGAAGGRGARGARRPPLPLERDTAGGHRLSALTGPVVSAGRDRALGGPAGGSGLGGGRLHQAALAAGGLVLVDDALGRGLVEALLGQLQGGLAVVRPGGARGGLDPGLELGAGRLVALGALGVGDDPLLLALDVGHRVGPLRSRGPGKASNQRLPVPTTYTGRPELREAEVRPVAARSGAGMVRAAGMVGSARRSERAAALVAAVIAGAALGLTGPAFGQPARPSALGAQSTVATPGSARFASGPIHGAGFMTVMAELPSGRLVAGGDSQGFFVSDDGGRSWFSRNVLRGGADPFASRGVASILVAPIAGASGSVPTLFAAVGKRDQPTAAMLRSDDNGETWVVDNGGKGIWFDGGNLPGASTPRSRATSRLIAIADRGPYAADRRLFAGDMTGCVWTRPLVDSGVWSLFACLPDPSRAPIRSVAVDSSGDVIIATSRMGLAGSRGGGAIPQPDQAGVWRLAVDPSCAVGLCGYVVPTSPLIMFAAASQSVEEVMITPDDHLYVAVVDDRLVNQGARLGGLWAGRSDGSPLVSVGFMGADTLRNVVSVDLVAGSSAVDTVITGASLPKAAATDVERTDFEVTRTRVRWDQGPFPTPELLEPLAQTTAVDLDLYGHDGLHWFVDGTSVLGDEQYVGVVGRGAQRRPVHGRRQGRALGVRARLRPAPPPWRPAVYGVGSTFLGDVALKGGTVFATDADRFLFRADLTEPQPVVRQELDQARTVAADITKGLSVDRARRRDGHRRRGDIDLRRCPSRGAARLRRRRGSCRCRSTASRWRSPPSATG